MAQPGEGVDRNRAGRAQIAAGTEPPDAIKEGPQRGWVAYPNINMMGEMTNAMEAARSYEANLGAMEITKDMAPER